MNRILLFCTFIMLTGCMTSDTFENISGCCIYINEGKFAKQILSSGGNVKNDIYGTVISYDYDKDFILAAQIPYKEDYLDMVSFYLRDDTIKYPPNHNSNYERSKKEADSIIQNDPAYTKIFKHKINYWIIDIKADSLIGPIRKSELEDTRKALKVSDRLSLDN